MKAIVYWSLWLLVFTIPMENMVVLEGLGTINRLIGLVCIGFALITVVARKEFKAPCMTLVMAFAFVIWSMASFFWTIDPENSKKGIFTFVQLFAFIWLIWEFVDSETDLYWMMGAYILGSYVAIGSLLYQFAQGIEVTYFRYSVPGFNANDIALTLALGIPMAWLLAVRQTRLLTSLPFYLYLPAAVYAVTLTASRAAFIAAVIASLFALWSFPRQRANAKILTLATFAVSLVVLIQIAPDYSWKRLATVGQDLSAGNLNAREYIWWNGIKVFADNPLLGVGVGGFAAGVEKYAYAELSPHNLFLAVMVGQGIIGLVLYLVMLFAAAKKIVHLGYLNAGMWVFTFTAWFAGVMTLGWAHSKPTWFLIGMLAAHGAQAEPESLETGPAADRISPPAIGNHKLTS